MGVPGPYRTQRGDRMAESILDLVTGYYFLGAVGFGAGTFLVSWNLSKNGISLPFVGLAWTIALYAGLFGARILYIIEQQPRLLLDDPFRALAFWHGGLAWQGGAVLGALAMLVLFRVARKPVWSIAGDSTFDGRSAA